MSGKEWLPWLPPAILALLLVVSPLPFGGVVPWAAAGLETAGFVLLALSWLCLPSERQSRLLKGPVLALAGLSLWALLQSMPLPTAWVEWLSPEQMRLRTAVAAALPLDAVSAAPALSIAPEVSRGMALRFAAFAALWAACLTIGQRRGARRLLGLGLATAVGAQLVIGLKSWFVGSREIWGRLVQTDGSRLHGTFVNPNHFALYLEIALALALALVWWSWRRARDLPTLEGRVLLAAPPLLLWLGLFVGLAFTASRAGLIAAVGGTLVQALVLWLAGRRRARTALALGALVVGGLAVVAWVGFRQGFGRWLASSSTAGLGSRAEVYEATLELWGRFPFWGTGLGTFREGFGLVQPQELAGSWWHAHSNWLELGATGGVVALGLVGLGLWLLVGRLWVVFRRGRRSEDRAAALAALGALAAVALHEAVDFGLTMPANAFTLIAVLALASAAAVERRPAAAPLRSVS